MCEGGVSVFVSAKPTSSAEPGGECMCEGDASVFVSVKPTSSAEPGGELYAGW